MADRRKCTYIINDGPSHEFNPSQESSVRKRKQRSITTVPLRKKIPQVHVQSLDVSETSASRTTATGQASVAKEISFCTESDSVKEIYMQMLSRHGAVTCVDEDYRTFVLPDYHEKNKCLKDEYVIVSRNVFKSGDEYRWIYSCSCNPARRRMLDALSPSLSLNEEDFDEPYKKCLHINTLADIADGFTESQGSSLEEEFSKRLEGLTVNPREHGYDKLCPKFDIIAIEGVGHAVCVREQTGLKSQYNIVKIDFRGEKPVLKCLSCVPSKENNKPCCHVQAILSGGFEVSDASEKLIDLLNSKPKWRSRYVPVAISKSSIPFSVNPEEQKANRTSLQAMMDTDGLIHLIPDSVGHCSCNSEWGREEFLEEVTIFTSTDILAGKVYIRRCTSCQQWKDYDGLEHQLLNMGSYLITHEVLRRYLRQFVTEGTTLSSFYQELCWQQCDSGNFEFHSQCTYNRFRYAWYSFLDLLDVNYIHGFACPECGDNPETVVMDGVALGVRKIFMPWRNFVNGKFLQPTLDGSSHNTRVFVNNGATRNLLKKFCETQLLPSEYRQLQTNCSLYQPSLNDFLTEFSENSQISFTCPAVYKDLFLCLASNYPVCGFLHYHERVFEIIENCLANDFDSSVVSDIILLEQQCPVLCALFKSLNWKIPNHLKPVLKEIIQKAKEPFSIPTHNLPECSPACECSGISYCPNLPKFNHRGEYVLDSAKTQKDSSCRKRGSSHASLIPGIFTVSCIHGICYGFQLMEDVESPNVPFTLLRTRFHTAPRLIIYDNACNLHAYCLNRDPSFFKNSWFMVDRFHWCNHKGCHIGYNLSCYFHLREVNSQVAEQRNATLKKLKSMLSYMNIRNFSNHLKIFMWFRNMLSLVKIRPDLPINHVGFFKSLLPTYSRLK